MFMCTFLSLTCHAPLITVCLRLLIGNSERLRLDDNELRGPLPSEMGLLSNLLYLDFQENILTGEIPGELGELTRLGKLPF